MNQPIQVEVDRAQVTAHRAAATSELLRAVQLLRSAGRHLYHLGLPNEHADVAAATADLFIVLSHMGVDTAALTES